MFLFTRLSSNYFWYFGVLGLVVPFMAVLLDAKQFSSQDIGEIIAIFTASKILGPSLWATLADKTGQQVSIIRLGTVLATLSFSALYWLESFWPITICLALFSFFWSAVLPQLEVMTLNSIRRDNKIYARVRLWGSIGFIVFVMIGGEVIERWLASGFISLALISLVILCISTLLLTQPRVNISQIQQHLPISNKIKDSRFILFFFAGVMLQISFGPYYGFFALFLHDLSYSGLSIGFMIALGVCAEIVIFLFIGHFFKHFSVKSLLCFSLFITSIRWYFVGQWGDNFVLLMLSQLSHAASFGIYHSASILFIQQHFDANQQSRGQAMYISGVYGIGGAIGAYVTGYLWLDGAGAENAFNFAAAIALLGTVLALMIPKR